MNAQTLSYREWTEHVRQYLDNLDVKCSSKTVYRKALNLWLSFIKNIDNSSDVNVVLRYKQSLIERKLSAYTICVYLNAVKNLFQYLEDNQITYNIAKSIRVKKPQSTRQALSKDEVLKLLNLEFKDDIEGLRNKTILFLKIYTALRDISIIESNIEDLRTEENRYLLFYQTKGHDVKDEFVILNEDVYNAISAYLLKRGNIDSKSPLFASIGDNNKGNRLSTQTTRKIIKGFFLKAGIVRDDIKPHSLRHSAITFAIRSGAKIENVRQMAAHASIDTTMSYYHAIDRRKNPAEFYIKKYLTS